MLETTLKPCVDTTTGVSDDFVIATGHQISVREFVESVHNAWAGVEYRGVELEFRKLALEMILVKLLLKLTPFIIALLKSIVYLAMLLRHLSYLNGNLIYR